MLQLKIGFNLAKGRPQINILKKAATNKQIKTQNKFREIMLGVSVCYKLFMHLLIILPLFLDFIQQHLDLIMLASLYKQYIPNIPMIRPESNSSDSIDPEFLTFRHNSPQALLSSGRTIYSHRFDYKSLQKYPIFDGSNSQRQDINERTHKKIKHSVKQKQMRTVKSQEKYKQLISPLPYNVEDSQEDKQQELKARGPVNQDEIRISQQDGKHFKYYKQKGQPNQTKVYGSQANLQKNIDLKSKLSKLIKSMRKQQRKQFTLQQQIQGLSADGQDLDKQIEDQQHNIDELKQINEENVKECNRIIESIRKVSNRNQEIASNLQSLEESVNNSQLSIDTYKQDETKDRIICARLKQGMGDLLKMKNSAEMRVRRLEQQIQLMQCQMQMMKNQEVDIGKILGLSCQSKYHNFSQNQSHSHNSSSGSNRQSVFYY